MLDGILRGYNEKWLGKRESAAVDGDLRLVHGFEESGLCARRSAVDLVGENDVGEDRAVAELKFARLGIVDADAKNVGREKVGSKLDALKAAVERFGEGLGERGLAGAGNILDEKVAACEKGDER